MLDDLGTNREHIDKVPFLDSQVSRYSDTRLFVLVVLAIIAMEPNEIPPLV